MAAKKRDIPAMPFFVGDWLKCPEVKVLPPDIRGLWFDMICYMWESVERGIMVKPNHQPYDKNEIIRMIGLDCNASASWLDVIISNGVCSIREKDGALYCRRMVRDEEIRLKRRAAGKKGGDITKLKVFQAFKEEVFEDTAPPQLTPEEQKKTEKAKKYKYADFVTLTKDEYLKLSEEFTEEGTKRIIQILNNYKGSKGKKYKSDYLAIRNWVIDRYTEELQKNGQRITRPVSENAGSENGNGFRDTF